MKANKNEPDKPYPWACGFCGPGSSGKPGVCYDRNHRCPGWVAGVECACAAASHYTVAARPVVTVELTSPEVSEIPPFIREIFGETIAEHPCDPELIA